MIKNKLIGKIGCLLMLVWASVSLHAQSIELLGLYSNGSAGQLKAKVELAGKQIKSVTSYAYRMSDGFATTASDYELIEGSFLTADVEMQTGDYAYRMEVVLDDDTRLLTECVNQANTLEHCPVWTVASVRTRICRQTIRLTIKEFPARVVKSSMTSRKK